MSDFDTVPSDRNIPAPHLALSPSVEDHESGALWLHKDYVQAVKPWENEAHQSPYQGILTFGDVPSFVSYVKNYGWPRGTLVAWNPKGLHARLDHMPTRTGEEYAREWLASDRWRAHMPYELDPSFVAWSQMCSAGGVSHQKFIEYIDDHMDEILYPPHAELLELLRTLRGNYNTTGESSFNQDGTYAVAFTKQTGLKGANGGEVTLPKEIEVVLPVMKGWLESETVPEEGKIEGDPVRYKFAVRLRVSVEANGHVEFYLTMPQRERVLAQVYGEIASMVQAAFGDEYELLRFADNVPFMQ